MQLIAIDDSEPAESGTYITLHGNGVFSVSEYSAADNSWRHIIHLHNGRVTYDECAYIDDVTYWCPELLMPTLPAHPPLAPLESMPRAVVNNSCPRVRWCDTVDRGDPGYRYGTVQAWLAVTGDTVAVVQEDGAAFVEVSIKKLESVE